MLQKLQDPQPNPGPNVTEKSGLKKNSFGSTKLPSPKISNSKNLADVFRRRFERLEKKQVLTAGGCAEKTSNKICPDFENFKQNLH